MNVEKVLHELKEKYPNKSIFQNKDEDGKVSEILCEVDPTTDHAHYSYAVAVADKSIPHYHKKSVETYTVTIGKLTLFVGNSIIELSEGNSYEIPVETVHWVKGNETWFNCNSKPGWTFEDHIIADTRNVTVVIFYDEDGNIGVQDRGKYSKVGEKYGLWGGQKDVGESAEKAIARETKEELGYTPDDLEFWTNFTYVVDLEGKYKNWMINHDVFVSKITPELMNADVLEGDSVVAMHIDQVLKEYDFRLLIPLFKQFRIKYLDKD